MPVRTLLRERFKLQRKLNNIWEYREPPAAIGILTKQNIRYLQHSSRCANILLSALGPRLHGESSGRDGISIGNQTASTHGAPGTRGVDQQQHSQQWSQAEASTSSFESRSVWRFGKGSRHAQDIVLDYMSPVDLSYMTGFRESHLNDWFRGDY